MSKEQEQHKETLLLLPHSLTDCLPTRLHVSIRLEEPVFARLTKGSVQTWLARTCSLPVVSVEMFSLESSSVSLLVDLQKFLFVLSFAMRTFWGWCVWFSFGCHLQIGVAQKLNMGLACWAPLAGGTLNKPADYHLISFFVTLLQCSV